MSHPHGSILKVKLNRAVIVNSFIGLVIALIFDDVKELIINEIIIKFVNTNVKTKEIELFGTKLDFERIIDLIVNIVLSIIFIYILYNHA
tara:strand:+ start:64 stop:333 length:270 start_codon:yes stop_codon:yes gene_type:complete